MILDHNVSDAFRAVQEFLNSYGISRMGFVHQRKTSCSADRYYIMNYKLIVNCLFDLSLSHIISTRLLYLSFSVEAISLNSFVIGPLRDAVLQEFN